MTDRDLIKELIRKVDLLEQKINIFTGPAKLREKFWTTKQVCEFLSLNRNTVYKYADQLGGHKIGTGDKTEWRFKPEMVMNFERCNHEN